MLLANNVGGTIAKWLSQGASMYRRNTGFIAGWSAAFIFLVGCLVLCGCAHNHQAVNYDVPSKKTYGTQKQLTNPQVHQKESIIIPSQEAHQPAKSGYNYSSPMGRMPIPLPQKEPENLPQEIQ